MMPFWTVLSLLLLIMSCQAQTIITQPEIDAWKARRSTGPYTADYQIVLDSANAWRTIMQGGSPEARFTGQTTNTCYNGNSTTVPSRTKDVGLRDAGFVYLMTGDTSYSTLVRAALLAQTAVVGTNFATATRWCPTTATLDGYGDYYQSWLRRLAFAYAYTKSTFSGGEQATMNAWFLAAAQHVDAVLHNIVKKRFPNRLSDNYAACDQNCPGEQIGRTHFGGPIVNRFHEAWSNKATGMNAAVAVIAVLVNNATLKANAKRFVKESITYASFPHGEVADQFRWGGVYATPGFPTSGTTPQHGYLYTGLNLGANLVTVDHLARDGDLELFTYSTSGGMFGTEGGPKTILKLLQHYASLTLETMSPVEYARDTATTDLNFRIDSTSSLQTRIEWTILPVTSTHYKDANVKLAYKKTFPGSWSTVGCDTRGGDWCVYPSTRFQFGDFEDILYPYGTAPTVVPSPPLDLRIDGQGPGVDVFLSWTASVSGVPTSYKVYWDTTPGTYGNSQSAGLALSDSVETLTPGFTYYFNATAINAVGESVKSNTVSVYAEFPILSSTPNRLVRRIRP